MKPPKIVKPIDWQRISTAPLTVVVEGGVPAGCTCRIWRRDDFATSPLAERPVLASAKLHAAGTNLLAAVFWELEPWQECILGVVDEADQNTLVVGGVILGLSSVTDWMAEGGSAKDANELPRLLHPLLLGCALSSHFGSADVTTQDDLVPEEAFWSDCAAGTFGLTPLDEAEIVDAAPALRLNGSVGLDQPKWRRLQCQSPYIASPTYLARFVDAHVSIPGGVIATQAQGLWSDSAFAAFFNDPELSQHQHLFRNSVGYGVAVHAEQELADCQGELSGVPLLLTTSASQNTAHWLVNSLYAAYRLRDRIIDGTLAPVLCAPSPYMVESLERLGIGDDRLLIVEPGQYHAETIYYPSSLSTHGNFCPPRGVADMFASLRGSSGLMRRQAPPQRIYVTRMGSKAQRRIVNEAELVTGLRRRGFVIIAPHELDLAEIIHVFSGVEIVVAQLGAGLANIGFAPPGCEVVEICSHNYTSNDYWFLAHLLGHRLTRVLVGVPSNCDFDMTDFGFEAPIEATLAAVDRLLR